MNICCVMLYFSTYSLIGMYIFLPETEGRTLEEVERFFSDKNRKLTDRYVPRMLSTDDRQLAGVTNVAMEP